MTFRDDSGAKDEHVQTLKTELEGARDDVARAQERIGELEAELTKLRDADRPPPPPAPPMHPPTRGLLIPLLVVLTGFAALYLASTVFRSPMASPRPSDHVAQTKTLAPRNVDAVHYRAERSATATWTARVRSSQGSPVSAGSTCTITATLDEHDAHIHVAAVRVRCGATDVYDSTYSSSDDMPHASAGEAREELTGNDGAAAFYLDFHDNGGGQVPEVAIDTAKRTASLWRYDAPPFRLDLTPAPQSAPVASGPLLERTRAGFHKTARVVSATGAAPVAVGVRCDVRVAPQNDHRCYAQVVCSGVHVYGESAFSAVANCNAGDVERGHGALELHDDAVSAVDEDPRLDLRVADGTVVVADAPAGVKPWKVELRIDPPATADAGH